MKGPISIGDLLEWCSSFIDYSEKPNQLVVYHPNMSTLPCRSLVGEYFRNYEAIECLVVEKPRDLSDVMQQLEQACNGNLPVVDRDAAPKVFFDGLEQYFHWYFKRVVLVIDRPSGADGFWRVIPNSIVLLESVDVREGRILKMEPDLTIPQMLHMNPCRFRAFLSMPTAQGQAWLESLDEVEANRDRWQRALREQVEDPTLDILGISNKRMLVDCKECCSDKLTALSDDTQLVWMTNSSLLSSCFLVRVGKTLRHDIIGETKKKERRETRSSAGAMAI